MRIVICFKEINPSIYLENKFVVKCYILINLLCVTLIKIKLVFIDILYDLVSSYNHLYRHAIV
jgi:hypothetical protein